MNAVSTKYAYLAQAQAAGLRVPQTLYLEQLSLNKWNSKHSVKKVQMKKYTTILKNMEKNTTWIWAYQKKN